MPLAKGFIYFVALKIGAQFLFDESLAVIAAAICAVIMVGVESVFGSVLIAPPLGRHLMRASMGHGGMLAGLRATLPGLAVCEPLKALLTLLTIYAFSREFWDEFTTWSGLDWERVATWAALVFAIGMTNHLMLVWAATKHARSRL